MWISKKKIDILILNACSEELQTHLLPLPFIQYSVLFVQQLSFVRIARKFCLHLPFEEAVLNTGVASWLFLWGHFWLSFQWHPLFSHFLSGWCWGQRLGELSHLHCKQGSGSWPAEEAEYRYVYMNWWGVAQRVEGMAWCIH